MLFSTRDRLRGQPGTFEVLECSDCQLARIRPVPTHDATTLNLEWIRDDGTPGMVRRLINSGRQLAAARMAKVIWGCARRGTVLDMGGGALLGSALRQRGLAVVAAAPTARPASSRFSPAGILVVQSRLPDGCFRRGTFDVIVGKHVLEHEREPRIALDAMLEMLAPNGSLVIQVPNANSWQAVLLAGAWAGFDIPRHPVSFDDASLERLLESCGLLVASRRTGSVFEAAFCLATSLCPWLDPDLRQIRCVREHRIVQELKDLFYCLIAIALSPLTFLELASDSGPAIVVEARRASHDVPKANLQRSDDEATKPKAAGVPAPEEHGR